MQHITAKPIRTTNRNAGDYVRNGVPFTNSNGQLFGRWETPSLYVVYSYGEHWPLFAWDNGTWYENDDRYSVTTTRHRTHAHPHTDTVPASRTYLKTIIANRISERSAARQMERLQDSLMGIAA